MFLRCKAVSDIARLRNRAAASKARAHDFPRRFLYASRGEEATGMPSHAATAGPHDRNGL